MRGLSLVAASGGHSSSRCAGLSLSWPLLLRSTGSRRPGSVVVAHRPSCSAACGIFPDQGSNPCPLHWQADSQPLCHQGSRVLHFLIMGVQFDFLFGVQESNIQMKPEEFPSCSLAFSGPALLLAPSFSSSPLLSPPHTHTSRTTTVPGTSSVRDYNLVLGQKS